VVNATHVVAETPLNPLKTKSPIGDLDRARPKPLSTEKIKPRIINGFLLWILSDHIPSGTLKRNCVNP